MRPRQLTHPVLAHPSVVFASMWLLVLLFVSMRVVPTFSLYADVAVQLAYSLVAANLFGAAIAATAVYRFKGYRRRICAPIGFSSRVELLYVWIGISIVEIAFSGGLPVVWLLTGSAKTYEQFGLPTLHGFANALWLFLSFSQLLKMVDSERKAPHVPLTVILILWPVLVVSRALFTILLIQAVIYFVITSQRALWRIALALLVTLGLFALAFGASGSARAPEFSLSSALGLGTVNSSLVDILWLYAYLVSPISNLALNVSVHAPVYSIFPGNTLSGLLPTVVKNAFDLGSGFNSYLGSLANGAFNVGTAFTDPYFDWGMLGVLGTAFVIGAVGHIVWLKARVSSRIPLLAAYCACTALTIFTDQFTQLMPLINMLLLTKFSFATTRLVEDARESGGSPASTRMSM